MSSRGGFAANARTVILSPKPTGTTLSDRFAAIRNQVAKNSQGARQDRIAGAQNRTHNARAVSSHVASRVRDRRHGVNVVPESFGGCVTTLCVCIGGDGGVDWDLAMPWTGRSFGVGYFRDGAGVGFFPFQLWALHRTVFPLPCARVSRTQHS